MCFTDIESFNDYINFIRAYFKIPNSAVKSLSFRSGVHCEIMNLLKMEAFTLQIVINVLCTNKGGILGTLHLFNNLFKIFQ